MVVKQAEIHDNVSDDFEPLEKRVADWLNRTPEEIADARARLFALSPEPRALPTGKTLEDVIVRQWPGDETDEEINAFLEDLS